MPFFRSRDNTMLPYWVRGGALNNGARTMTTTDVLLLAPGGMNSTIQKWNGHAYDAWELLSSSAKLKENNFRIIAMDQRNTTPRTVSNSLGDGWETYRDDQLALLDRLGSKKCLLVGSCIGPSFCLALMKHSPERFPVAVLFQPIGLAYHTTEEAESWEGLNSGMRNSFRQWSANLLEQGRFSQAEFDKLHQAMYGGDASPPRPLDQKQVGAGNEKFCFSVSRADVQEMKQHMLVFMGKDRSHPSQTSRDIANLAENATLIENWRDEYQDDLQTTKIVEDFLLAHAAP